MLKPPTEYVPPPPPPLIEQAVRDRALKNMRAIARGNGIKPESITIENVTAQTLSFDAHTYIRLTTQFQSRTEPGKSERGEPVGSPEAFQAMLRNMPIQAQREAAKRRNIIDLVLARPDKGYGARDQVFKVDGLSRDLVSHEACASCNHTGKTTCPKCGGKTFVNCQQCHGRHNILCPKCRGTGQMMQGGKQTTCTSCRGKCRVQCPSCHGRGDIPCKNCQATGAAPCTKCKGTGWLSHFAKVEMLAHLHFDYDRQGLPIELTKLLDAFAPKYVEKKNLEATLLTPDYEENEPPETVPIFYKMRIPHGEITFNFGPKKTVAATMLGWNAEFTKSSDFLDDLTKRGQGELLKASNGEGDVGANLRSAARYRILREAIILSAGAQPLRKSLSMLLQKYPVGMPSDKVHKFLMQAHTALQIIARKPKIIGLCGGAVAYSALALGYFAQGRETLAPQLTSLPVAPDLALMGCDALVMIGGIAICVLSSQLTAGHALKAALKGLASPAAIKRIIPKVGWALPAAVVIAAAITAIFYFMFVLK